MQEQFASHLKRSGLIPPGSTVLVGYSGGADSTCLLHLLSQIGLDCVAAHLHHGQRPEADDEARRCENFCAELHIPIVVGRADIPQIVKDRGIGIEEAGREARYAFFRQVAFQTRTDLIATAHTQDDHLETILFHLARGTGLAGLAGIPEQRGEIIRPLLPFRRADTRRYCDERDLWYHDDPANDDHSLSRVRLRQVIIPAFESVHTGFRSSLERMSRIVKEEDQFLNGVAGNLLGQAETPMNGKLAFLTRDVEFMVDRTMLLAAGTVLVRRAARLGAEFLGANLDFHQSETLAERLSADLDGSLTATGGKVVIEWNSEYVHFRSLIVDAPFRFQLTVPGETIADAFGWQFTASSGVGLPFHRDRDSLDVILETGEVPGGLYFRSAEQGDRIQPLGMMGHKKIADLMSEAGLTLAARQRLPIICDMVGPIWVPGIAIDERVKVTDQPKRPIRLTFEPTVG